MLQCPVVRCCQIWSIARPHWHLGVGVQRPLPQTATKVRRMKNSVFCSFVFSFVGCSLLAWLDLTSIHFYCQFAKVWARRWQLTPWRSWPCPWWTLDGGRPANPWLVADFPRLWSGSGHMGPGRIRKKFLLAHWPSNGMKQDEEQGIAGQMVNKGQLPFSTKFSTCWIWYRPNARQGPCFTCFTTL